jgi:hypothetical protein
MKDRYKEGVDFKWVPMRDKDGDIIKDGRGGAVKTRKFFTKAEKEAMKSKDKPKAKPKASSSAPESTPTRPQARRTEGQIRSSSGGRTRYTPSEFTNDGGPRRGGRKPKSKSEAPSAMTEAPTLSGNQTSSGGAPINKSSPDSNISAGYGSLANAANRMKFYEVSKADKTINGVSFDEWKKLTRAQRVVKNLPLTNQEFMRAMRLKGAELETSAPSVSTGSRGRKQKRPSSNYTQEELDSRSGGRRTGMSKGGMVKSGNKDYKKSGMFYKSASPRGYK